MGIFSAIGKGFGIAAKLINVVFIFMIFNLIVGFISLPLANPQRAQDPKTVAIAVISSIIFFLIFIFLQGGALGMVRDQMKTGAANIAKFTGYGKSLYLRILGLLLMYLLLAIGVVLILALLSAGLLLLGDNAITRGIVVAVVSVAAILIITLLIYPIYSLVLDNSNVFDAFKKGISTARSNFWRTLGLFMTVLLISVLISIIIGFVVGLVSAPFGQKVGQIVITVINSIIQSYIPIVIMAAFMNYYAVLSENK